MQQYKKISNKKVYECLLLEKEFIMTKYECARIICVRAAQLSMTVPILVNVPPHLSSNFMYIVTKELKKGA